MNQFKKSESIRFTRLADESDEETVCGAIAGIIDAEFEPGKGTVTIWCVDNNFTTWALKPAFLRMSITQAFSLAGAIDQLMTIHKANGE